jgi:hypothetical protein
VLCACNGGLSTGEGTTPSHSIGARPASGSYGLCPADPNGFGILPDGDFSQGENDGDNFTEPRLGVSFAPGWKVSHRNIDFNGTAFWNMDGYPSAARTTSLRFCYPGTAATEKATRPSSRRWNCAPANNL